MVYEPAEDTYLLLKWAKKLAKGKILEMGCGTGIIAANVNAALACDISSEVVQEAKKRYPHLNVIQSDLFEKIDGRFDTIIFNPPYLPESPYDSQSDTTGGKEGYETIIRFLEQAREHLTDDGIILMVFSSLSKPSVILAKARELGYEYELLESINVGFERLFCCLFRLSDKKHI